jgi:putative hydrolase of the HAD superfamily
MTMLFDLGGVFIPDSTRELNRAMARLIGMPEAELAGQWTAALPLLFTGKLTIREFYARLLGGTKDPDMVLAEHLGLYARRYRIEPAMLELLSRLKERHVTACLTNTEGEVARINHDKGLYQLFHHAFLSTELGLMKPEPAMFLRAMERLRAAADDVVFVDDKGENIEAAHRLGMRAILFLDAHRLERDLAAITGGRS